METLFRKVLVSERVPKFTAHNYQGYFYTNKGIAKYDKYEGWESDIDWWLEEIQLPSEEEINEALGKRTRGAIPNAMHCGVDYILGFINNKK